jgi:hypothetical protein
MRRCLAPFSGWDASYRMPRLAGCITNTPGFRFSARTGLVGMLVEVQRPSGVAQKPAELALTLLEGCAAQVKKTLWIQWKNRRPVQY